MSGDHNTRQRPNETAEPPGGSAATAATATVVTAAATTTITTDAATTAVTVTTTEAVPTGVLLSELDLPARGESVPRARGFVRSFTAVHGIPHIREDAEILVSELITNALQHAATPGCTLRLLLVRTGARLRIEVHDPSPVIPKVKRVNLLDETGRGWFLVAIIAERHGTDLTPFGKSVWCELSAWPPAETAPH